MARRSLKWSKLSQSEQEAGGELLVMVLAELRKRLEVVPDTQEADKIIDFLDIFIMMRKIPTFAKLGLKDAQKKFSYIYFEQSYDYHFNRILKEFKFPTLLQGSSTYYNPEASFKVTVE